MALLADEKSLGWWGIAVPYILKVELIYDLACPNIAQSRVNLLRAFELAGITLQWDRNDIETPIYARQLGSPSILVDGKDVAGESNGGAENNCRIYLASSESNKGVPPVSMIVNALSSGVTTSSGKSVGLVGGAAVGPGAAAAFIGQLYPFEQRGRPLGWRGLFVAVGAMGAVTLALLWPHRKLLGEKPPSITGSVGELFRFFGTLLTPGRGLRTYSYVFLNAIFHSGVYTWLGVYLSERYHLSVTEIGLALLGYGIPGFLFGPMIGRLADRYGRRWLIPAGLAIAAVSAR